MGHFVALERNIVVVVVAVQLLHFVATRITRRMSNLWHIALINCVYAVYAAVSYLYRNIYVILLTFGGVLCHIYRMSIDWDKVIKFFFLLIFAACSTNLTRSVAPSLSRFSLSARFISILVSQLPLLLPHTHTHPRRLLLIMGNN